MVDKKVLGKLDGALDSMKFMPVLNAGKGSQENSESESFGSIKRQHQDQAGKPPKQPAQVEQAAKDLFAWLSTDNADIVMHTMEIFSGVGLMWSRYSALRAMQSWSEHHHAQCSRSMQRCCVRCCHPGRGTASNPPGQPLQLPLEERPNRS